MKAMNIEVWVRWAPRSTNREADALANDDSRRSDLKLDVHLNAEDLNWLILPRDLDMGREAEEEFSRATARGASRRVARSLRLSRSLMHEISPGLPITHICLRRTATGQPFFFP